MHFNKILIALAAVGFASSAYATNGYFSHGYGMKAKGMAGAAPATASDTFGGANNPASMVWVGNRIDLGVDVFAPRREFSFDGGEGAVTIESEDDWFLIPEFGYNRMLKPNLSLGISVYGNGGMNSDYPNANYFGVGDMGVDLMQLMIAPTLSYKINDQHSIGIAPTIAAQRFAAQGLQGFGVMKPDGSNIGYDMSWGYGARIGWMGKFTDKVTVGASYATKMRMDKFDDYAGLFAEQGDFDIPSTWNVGIAVQATPQVKMALDFQRINYSDTKSINNPSTNIYQCDPVLNPSYCLGGDNGPGFGWDDVNVWKLGVEYAYSNNLTLRAGYNHGDNPIQARDVTFNILAPGVVQNHLTLGFTYTTASGGELTMAYMHAFENDVTGNNLFFPVTENIKMHQDSLGIAYGWKM